MTAMLETVQTHSPRAVEAVVKGMQDGDHQVRAMAARAASGWPSDHEPLRDPRVAAALASILRDPDPETRTAAARSLAQVGLHGALPDLLHAWPEALAAHEQHPYDVFYEGLAEALGASGDEAAVTPLVELLMRGGPRERQIARGALRDLGQLTTNAVIELLHNPDPAIRIEAVEHLGAIRAAETCALLVAMLGDPAADDWLGFPRSVRDAAKSALVAIGPPALPALQRAVAEGGKTRRLAAEALSEIRAATA